MISLCRLAPVLLLFALRGQAQVDQPSSARTGPTAAEIHGKVAISAARQVLESRKRDNLLGRYAGHGNNESAFLVVPPAASTSRLSERAVVYLESDELDRHEYPLPTKHPMLDQKNLQFHPQVLPILVGTTVDFPNRDNLFHNVFSYSEAKDFDLGRYPKNDSRSVTFDKPGIVRVYCDIHSNMYATILVLRHPYFAVPDDNGDYFIRNVPPGKYKIALWYDRDVVERRTIDVQEHSLVEADFTY
ncbi:MAG: carboxypeptidase regulatory-like domain-containing protein [Bacteroidota bacterium]